MVMNESEPQHPYVRRMMDGDMHFLHEVDGADLSELGPEIVIGSLVNPETGEVNTRKFGLYAIGEAAARVRQAEQTRRELGTNIT